MSFARITLPGFNLPLPALITLAWVGFMAVGASLEAPPQTKPKPEIIEKTPPKRKSIHAFYTDLKSPDLALIRRGASGLARNNSKLSIRYLMTLYTVGDAARRKIALDALTLMDVPTTHQALFENSLLEPTFALRKQMARMLSQKTGHKTILEKYFQVLNTPQKFTKRYRFRAVQLVAHLGGTKAANTLSALLADKDAEVASAAAEGLATLGDLNNVQKLIPFIETKDPELGPAIADALEYLTNTNNRFNLVKWEQWLNDFKTGKIIPPKKQPPENSFEEAKKEEKESAYNPDYRDPNAIPIHKSSVDIVFVFDTTGSQARIWLNVVAAMSAVLKELLERTPSLRLGAVRYRADSARKTQSYMIKIQPLTRKVQEATDFIKESTFALSGGSDGWHLGLQQALQQFTWRVHSRKIIMILGDTSPPPKKLSIALSLARDAWNFDAIQINTLLIPTAYHPGNHHKVYGHLARTGSGRFYKFMRQTRAGHLSDFTDLLLNPKAAPDGSEPEWPGVTYQKWITPVHYPTSKTLKIKK